MAAGDLVTRIATSIFICDIGHIAILASLYVCLIMGNF